RQLRGGIDWILDSGLSWHICTNKDLFITYEEYVPGTAIEWDSSAGQGITAEGHGDIILPIRKPDRSRHEMKLHCEYKSGNKFNLLGYIKAHKGQGIEWSLRDMLVRHDKGEAIAYTFIAKNVPFIELAHELFPRTLPEAESTDLRRLRINKDKLGYDIGTEHYDCEPCGKGKSKRIVSQDHQARATKVGQLLHIDLYPVQPKGIDNRTNKVDMEYAMVITDDASRFPSAICIAKKSEASLTLEGWTEQFKQHAGYYPTE
ncbi:hypothetical protein N7527_007009, partial [Penicillium freii]